MALSDAGVGSACRTLALQHPAWCSHCNTNTCLEVWANPLCEAVGGFPWNRKMTASSQHCGGTQNGSSCTMRLLCRWWCVLVLAPAWPCVCAAGSGAAERSARLCGLLCRQNSCPIKHKCTDLCIHKVLLKRFPCICKSEILSIRYFCSALSYGAEWKHLKDVHPNNSYVHLWNHFFPSPFTFLLLPKSVASFCWACVCLLEGDGCAASLRLQADAGELYRRLGAVPNSLLATKLLCALLCQPLQRVKTELRGENGRKFHVQIEIQVSQREAAVHLPSGVRCYRTVTITVVLGLCISCSEWLLKEGCFGVMSVRCVERIANKNGTIQYQDVLLRLLVCEHWFVLRWGFLSS